MKCFSRGMCAAAALLLCSVASPAKATTVAAVITPDQIVLAADSLLSDGNGEAVALTNKINVFGQTTVAVAGLVKMGDFFDIFDVVAEACKEGTPLQLQAETFAGMMNSKLQEISAIHRVAAEAPLEGGDIKSAVWLCGFESGRPVLHEIGSEMPLTTNAKPKINVRRLPAAGAAPMAGVLFLGPKSIADRKIQLNPKKLGDVNYLMTTAQAVVSYGIIDPKGRSGGIMDVIQISRSGRKWLKRAR